MLGMLHALLLAALGGVRMRDAVEAALFERQRPSLPRHEALEPAAHMICRRADVVEVEVRSAMGRQRS